MPNITEKQWQVLRQHKQCWDCVHNEVSDLCNDCLAATALFEKSNGIVGAFKPNFEKGEHWNKYPGGE